MSGSQWASLWWRLEGPASGSVCEVACRSRREGKLQELVWTSSQQVLRPKSQVLRPTIDVWSAGSVTDTRTPDLLGVLEWDGSVVCEEGGKGPRRGFCGVPSPPAPCLYKSAFSLSCYHHHQPSLSSQTGALFPSRNNVPISLPQPQQLSFNSLSPES